MRLFVSGTGTGVGKTCVTRGLARLLASRNLDVVALKPIETGCAPDPLDALALARACGRPEAAEGFYRVAPPLAPLAAALEGAPAPDLVSIVAEVRAWTCSSVLVEGAGGVLVPLDDERDMLDLARAIDARVLLVARDELGVLSAVATAAHAVMARDLELAAIVLTRGPTTDASVRTNATILGRRLPCPIVSFVLPESDDDVALARAAEPLADALGLTRRRPAP